VWLGHSAAASDLSGTARVIDGDTIAIGNTRIRLWGIDAPEREQTCFAKNGDIYECGRGTSGRPGRADAAWAGGVRTKGL
jgi:endonuclease YncB( thermonuclease family)